MESSGAVWDSRIADIQRIYKEKRKHIKRKTYDMQIAGESNVIAYICFPFIFIICYLFYYDSIK